MILIFKYASYSFEVKNAWAKRLEHVEVLEKKAAFINNRLSDQEWESNLEDRIRQAPNGSLTLKRELENLVHDVEEVGVSENKTVQPSVHSKVAEFIHNTERGKLM